MEVLVVGQGQAFEHRQKRGEIANQTAALAAHQLGEIGVLLLRHHAAARGPGIVHLDIAEFGRGPQHQFLRQAREVDAAQRCAGHELDGEIPIRHGVDAVG